MTSMDPGPVRWPHFTTSADEPSQRLAACRQARSLDWPWGPAKPSPGNPSAKAHRTSHQRLGTKQLILMEDTSLSAFRLIRAVAQTGVYVIGAWNRLPSVV